MEETNKPKKTYLLTSFARMEGVDQSKTLFREFEYTPENKELEYTFLEYDKEEKTPLPVLGPLSQINVFIGQNNSRKSRLLRQIAAAKEDTLFIFDWHRNPMEEIGEFLELARELVKENGFFSPYDRVLEFKNYFRNGPKKNLYTEEELETLSKYEISVGAFDDIINISQDDSLHQLLNHLRFLAYLISLAHKVFNTFEESYTTYYNRPAIQKPSYYWNNFRFYELHYKHYSKYARGFNNRSKVPLLEVPRYKDFENWLTKANSFIDFANHLLKVISNSEQKNRLYIPTLRGAGTLYQKQKDKLTSISQDIYRESVYKYYYGLDKDSIYTGQSLYKDIRKSRNGRKKQRDAFSEFEKFIQEQFFPNHDEVDIVALEEEEGGNINIYLSKDSDQGRELHDLGDGLQALILMLYPIFMAEKGSIFLIEEPEMHLHPGLLSTFIRTLLREEEIKKKELRFFFSTHSTHLLDFVYEAPEDFSLFALEQNHQSKGSSYIRQIKEKDIALLNLMGVNNSSLFIANSSIWVEGHTDRKYIQGLLYAFEQYLKEKLERIPSLQEDLHYCFFEFAGSNIGHYLFGEEEENEPESKITANFLQNKICLVHDQDHLGRKAKSKAEQHERLDKAENEAFAYSCTDGVEMENILSVKTWEYLIDHVILRKKENFSFGEAIQYESYKNEKIADFLNEQLSDKECYAFLAEKEIKSEGKGKLADAFLKAVLNGDLKWAEIASPGTKAMLKEVYLFIAEHNPNLFSTETIDEIKELLA
ncbi:ATP/GTP-binding protein [Saprospira grandis str. Lewin]|uniref:ATP/GTP-binding protein n=2 Tax=Saprospira TaxID=1007 RepID=H6L7B2_SAPGL|nr:ATP/GTP-binding protein [Saprospira grandis str. Lewin]